MNRVTTFMGLLAEELRELFTPTRDSPPVGGGTDTIHFIAGNEVVLPLVQDDCPDMYPYLWVRLVSRSRHGSDVADCESRRAFTVEAGIARCSPWDIVEHPDEQEQQAMAQWDDSRRIDMALCRALSRAENEGVSVGGSIGRGEPYGPQGLVIAWMQTATVRL